MEQILTGVVVTVFLAWAGWVSVSLVGLTKSSSAQDAVKLSNSQTVEELKKSFQDMERRVTESLDKMNERQDSFMKAEIQELKNLLRNE